VGRERENAIERRGVESGFHCYGIAKIVADPAWTHVR
jgi:hypothetical protein